MQEFILIAILVILLFRVVRRFVFFNAYKGFQQAAEDFLKKQEQEQKPEGTVTVHPGSTPKGASRQQSGDYVDFEEIS